MRPTLPRRTSIASVRPRGLRFEPLEDRRVLDASPWQNPLLNLDVNNDGVVVPLDAIIVINGLLESGIGPLGDPPSAGDPPSIETPEYFIDTNGDYIRSPSDALKIINRLIAPPTVVLDTLMPFTIDLTPRLVVSASGGATVPDGATVHVDVDLDNNGLFVGNELDYTLAQIYEGMAEFALGPALPPSQPGGTYNIKLRARVQDAEGVMATSSTTTMIVDTRMSDALENYVNTDDGAYQYSLARTIPGVGYTAYILDMTSQIWQSAEVVDKPVWRHWVEVVVPTGVTANSALLYISGGNNNFGSPPTSVDAATIAIALGTQSVAARLRTVPSEPLVFLDEQPTRDRSEDEIIAYSFDQYFAHVGEPEADTWPVLIAMAKSAVRAMDTLQDFVPTVTGGTQIDEFYVTGYSKRGWTTWLTAAVDDRVKAIIPGVFDNPNQGPQMVHHFGVYGFFSEAVHDYNDLRIFERLRTVEAQYLSQIVDPYRYFNNGRFDDMPKLVLNSAGDEFFVSDSSQFYFADIPGENNYLRYFPNTGHGLNETAVTSTVAFMNAVQHNLPLPKFSWTIEYDHTIRVQTVDEPIQVLLWQATNPVDRDFRRTWHPDINWTSTPLSDEGGGVYSAWLPTPETGATAYFIELTYASALPGVPHVFTTDIRVNSFLARYEWPYESVNPDPSIVLSGDQGLIAVMPSYLFDPADPGSDSLIRTFTYAPAPVVSAEDAASASSPAADAAAYSADEADDDTDAGNESAVDAVFGEDLDEILL